MTVACYIIPWHVFVRYGFGGKMQIRLNGPDLPRIEVTKNFIQCFTDCRDMGRRMRHIKISQVIG